MRTTLFAFRMIYGAAVLYGVWTAGRLLLDVRTSYQRVVRARVNGSLLFLAHSSMWQAWFILVAQSILLAILIIGGFIPLRVVQEEGAWARVCITVLHTSLTLLLTWKVVRKQRDRKVLQNMIDVEIDRLAPPE